MTDNFPPPTLPDDIIAFYSHGLESGRLLKGIGPLEFIRTQELIGRYFPPSPAVIFDIGGGPGAYSLWLARLGYEVHLVDAVPLHVEQARLASQAQPDHPMASLEVGDARRLAWPGDFADAVLLHGPLYHLVKREDRLQALSETWRVLKEGGVVLAVGISHYASTLVGLVRGLLDDTDYLAMCKLELTTGEHIPPASWPELFTNAYFHRPGEIEGELLEAGFIHQATLAIQGMVWLAKDFDQKWQDEHSREDLLEITRLTECESGAIGMSPHIIAVAQKPV